MPPGQATQLGDLAWSRSRGRTGLLVSGKTQPRSQEVPESADGDMSACFKRRRNAACSPLGGKSLTFRSREGTIRKTLCGH